MRSEGQIRHKLKQVTFRHLQREIRTSLSCRPENCAHNRAVRLPAGEVRFCDIHVDEDGLHQVCDESHNGLTQARDCQDFDCANTKENVQADFKLFLQTSEVGAIAARYPDIAALMWVLNGEMVEVPEDEPTAVQERTVPFDWSKRLFLVPDGGPLPLNVQPIRFHRVIDYGFTVAFTFR